MINESRQLKDEECPGRKPQSDVFGLVVQALLVAMMEQVVDPFRHSFGHGSVGASDHLLWEVKKFAPLPC